jgi:hypothetical protein
VVRLGERAQKALGQLRRIGLVHDARLEHREFVATEPRNEIGATKTLA